MDPKSFYFTGEWKQCCVPMFVCFVALRPKSTSIMVQGSKIALARSYLRVPQAAGQANILIFLGEINFSPNMQIIFVVQGKYLF